MIPPSTRKMLDLIADVMRSPDSKTQVESLFRTGLVTITSALEDEVEKMMKMFDRGGLTRPDADEHGLPPRATWGAYAGLYRFAQSLNYLSRKEIEEALTAHKNSLTESTEG